MPDCGPRRQRASKVALIHGKMVPTTIESREEGREEDAQDQVQQDGGKSQNKRELTGSVYWILETCVQST